MKARHSTDRIIKYVQADIALHLITDRLKFSLFARLGFLLLFLVLLLLFFQFLLLGLYVFLALLDDQLLLFHLFLNAFDLMDFPFSLHLEFFFSPFHLSFHRSRF